MPLSRRTEPTHEAYAQAARETGDAAILVERVMSYSTSVSQGRDGRLRLRWWWRRSRSRNLGPRGGGHVSIGYAADTHLIDTGRRALAMDCQGKFPTSGDVQTQIQELARAVFSGADKSRVF